MQFATLDHARVKGGTAIGWCWWPETRGETLTSHPRLQVGEVLRRRIRRSGSTYETCAGCYAQNTAHTLCVRFDSASTTAA
jgi:hypothetical protein